MNSDDQAGTSEVDAPNANQGDWLARAKALHEEQRYEDALAVLEQVLEADPGSSEGWVERGIALSQMRRYKEALAAFDRALALDPANAGIWTNKGSMLAKLQRHEDALAANEQALAFDPNLAAAWYHKGVTFFELERCDEALAAYDQALSLNRTFAPAWYHKGVTFFELERYDEALAAYEQALALDATDAWAWNNKGEALFRLQRYDEALAAYNQALALDSADALAWNNKGNTLERLERYEDALAAFEQALALDPTYVWAWNNKGHALALLQRYEEAIAAYEQALALDPANALARGTKGAILLLLQRYEEALAIFEEMLRREPENARIRVAKGMALHQLGRSAEALAAYDEASRFLPDDPVVSAARAEARRAVSRTTTDQRLRLRDGRTLGYLDYGDPAGTPIICCHGTPGSRLDFFNDEELLRELGIRVIIPDRPGYGLSTFQRRRRLLDWPADVAQLADHLGLAQFALLGVSGGGPHALACAAVLESRLTRVGVVSSAAALELVPRLVHLLPPRERVSLVIARFLPWPFQWALYTLAVRVVRAYPELLQSRVSIRFAPRPLKGQEGGRRAHAEGEQMDLSPMLRERILEPYRQGAHGHAWDARLCYRRWGFRLKDLAGVEIHLWHGERDQLAPVVMGRALAAALPGCRATFYADEGHDVLGSHLYEILTALAAAPTEESPLSEGR